MIQLKENIQELANKYGYLPYMIDRYVQFLGFEETIKLLEANERPLIPSIRVNTLKISVKNLKEMLESKGFILESIDWIPHGFKVTKAPLNLGSLHEYLQGYFYIQNVASMIPAIILDPKPNETVIDMCSAPGGKATHLAQLMENEGILVLIEKYKKRIPSLEMNLRRMGILNSITINFDANHLEKTNIKADKILLDGPCTGEGLIREDSIRKKSRLITDIQKLATIQKQLLTVGLNSLKDDGKLLYCTCSIAPEENEIVIDQVLKKFPSFSISKIPVRYGIDGLREVYGKILRSDLKFSQRLYPHIQDTIGFYLCLIEKNASINC